MFKDILDGLKSYNNTYILMVTFLIIIFEFFIDIPAFKKAKAKKDANVTVVMNVVLFVMMIALIIMKT